MSETIAAWRVELEAELDEARVQLNTARREFADVAEAARNERRGLNDLMLIMAGHDARMPLATVLQRRIADRQDAVRRALGAATRCEATVTALVARIADLETAVRQLEQLQATEAEAAG